MRWYLALWLTLSLATPAEAGPLATAIGGLITAVKGFAAINALTGWLVKTVASIALSRLAMALRGTQQQPGIKTEMTTSGGTTPWRFQLGTYATGGQLIAPPMSYGNAGKTPRAYLVYAIALSVVPGSVLARVIINDDYVTLGSAGATWGRPVTGRLADVAWIDFCDGSQTAAHPDLLAAFGSDPDRPWSSDMVGTGTAYAVCRFKLDRERFNGLPSVRFEMAGIPLYDPRADSTVGGAGAQRWTDPGTWARTDNLAVIIYNVMRGIDVGGGGFWGGEYAAEDLPLANWFAAMNECDLPISRDGGGSEPQYRGGFEVEVDMEPFAVIGELLKACSGSMVEVGGVWKIRVGAPALPSYFLTDEDIIASQAQEFAPFPGLADTYNGITATYPEPASLWEAKDAPPRFDAAWEAEDGGRRLVANLSLPACPHGTQVQRLMAAAIADHRRMRSHRLVLPPEAAVLEPLETVGWTSVCWGYSAKTFEITSLTDSLMSMLQGLSLRERDAADFAWDAADEVAVPAPSTTTTPPTPQAVPGFSASPEPLADGAAIDRRPAIRLAWDVDGADDARALSWELRLDGGVGAVLSGSHANVGSGYLVISDGLIPAQAYEARAIYLVDRATDWSDWEPVTAPSILISTVDVAAGAVEARFDTASEATLDIATGATETVVFDLSLPATFVDSTGVPAVFTMTVRVRNDDTGRTRIACRLRALTGPDDHPDTGDWENLGLEYIYLRAASDQDIEYKQAIWIIDDFDFTTASRLQIEASYLTNATYTGTDTAFGKRVFSGRQTKRG